MIQLIVEHDEASILKNNLRDFPGSPVVKTLSPTAGITDSILGQGSKIPHAIWHGQKFFLNKN